MIDPYFIFMGISVLLLLIVVWERVSHVKERKALLEQVQAEKDKMSAFGEAFENRYRDLTAQCDFRLNELGKQMQLIIGNMPVNKPARAAAVTKTYQAVQDEIRRGFTGENPTTEGK